MPWARAVPRTRDAPARSRHGCVAHSVRRWRARRQKTGSAPGGGRFEKSARREDERVVGADELERRREAVLGWVERERQRGQARRIERIRVLDQPLPDVEIAGAARAEARSDDGQRRREE